MELKKINDIFPGWKTGHGIISEIETNAGIDFLGGVSSDILYHAKRQ